MKTISIDTETTGLTLFHGCQAFMLQLCDGENNHWWTGHVDPYDRTNVTWNKSDLIEFLDLFEEADVCVFHNAKFDIRVIYNLLKKYDLHQGFLTEVWKKFECTMLACHAIQSGFSTGLKQNAFLYLDYYNDNQKLLKQAILSAKSSAPKEYDLAKLGHPAFGGTKKTKWYACDYWLDIPACTEYGIDDIEMTYLLWKFVHEGMKSEGLLPPYEVRKKLLEVLFYIENVGINMYTELIEEEIDQLTFKCEKLKKQIEKDNHYQSTLNLNTRDGLLFLIHTKLNIPSDFHTPSGQVSVKKDAIEYYIETYPEIKSLQHLKEYRKSQTQISDIKTFADWLCPDDRLHCSYWVTGTRETRQSVELPAIQTISKSIRHLMGPPPGKVWLQYDLVNIEMRRWVYFVGNQELMDVFDKGGSVHLLIAETLYPKEYKQHGDNFKNVYADTLYKYVKAGNFSALYGAGEKRSDDTYRVKGSRSMITERFPEIKFFADKCEQEVLTNYELYNQPCVTVDGGYRLDVPLNELYKAVNYKVQGCAGWIMGEALIEVHNNPRYQSLTRDHTSGMVSTVHDSLDIEVQRDELTFGLVQTFKLDIERVGYRYMPTNEASCDILSHYTEPKLHINYTTEQIEEAS